MCIRDSPGGEHFVADPRFTRQAPKHLLSAERRVGFVLDGLHIGLEILCNVDARGDGWFLLFFVTPQYRTVAAAHEVARAERRKIFRQAHNSF